MSTVTMISLAKHTYNGRVVLANEAFDANNETDAADLVALRIAQRQRKVPAILAKPAAYEARVMQPAAEPVHAKADDAEEEAPILEGVTDEPAPEVKQHSYNRRDLRAKR